MRVLSVITFLAAVLMFAFIGSGRDLEQAFRQKPPQQSAQLQPPIDEQAGEALREIRIQLQDAEAAEPLAGNSGEVVHYVDRKGVSHFVDGLEKVPEQYRSTADVNHQLPKITKSDFKFPAVEQPPKKERTSAKKVEAFVTSWCPVCRQLEDFFKANNISYQRYDIEKSKTGAELYRSLGESGVPIVRVGGQVFRGFNPEQLAQVLSKR